MGEFGTFPFLVRERIHSEDVDEPDRMMARVLEFAHYHTNTFSNVGRWIDIFRRVAYAGQARPTPILATTKGSSLRLIVSLYVSGCSGVFIYLWLGESAQGVLAELLARRASFLLLSVVLCMSQRPT